MAKQPFEPSRFPAGERQLDLARTHVETLKDEFGQTLPEHVVEQLDHLEQHLTDALDARTSDLRLSTIDAATERVEALVADSALNPTLSSGLERRVGTMLDKAAERVEDAE